MKRIEMVDLKGQYEHIKTEIDNEIFSVINSSQFVRGSKVEEFQHHLERYLNVKHVIPVGNGTDALMIALMAAGLRRGDEVIVPAFTFVATAEVVALLGMVPVFVDVDYDTMNMSVGEIEKVVTPRTKAIIPVHLFGQNVDMESLMDIAARYGLCVIEDACQSIGAEYRYSDGSVVKSGCMGFIGCTSFFPSKNLGCYGDGGALFTNDDAVADKIRVLANHGMRKRYHHEAIGLNSRLDSIQAAVLDVKLLHLDEYTKRRQAVAQFYADAFLSQSGILTPCVGGFTTHVYHQYTLRCVGIDRDLLRNRLMARGVPSMVYYPIPLHLQAAYKDYYNGRIELPVAERLSREVLSMPIHTEMDEEQLNYIVKSVKECLE